MTGPSLPWKMDSEHDSNGWMNRFLCLEDDLYPTINSINTFRCIYNECLEGENVLKFKKEYLCSECGSIITKYSTTGKCKSCSHKGNKLSATHRAAISLGNKGKIFSEDHRKKLSEIASRRIGIRNGMYNKNHTEESKTKMSQTRKDRYGVKKKVKQISSYIDYDRDSRKEVVWRQKIDEYGNLQGTGFFSMRHPGRGTLVNRRRWSIECNSRRRSYGHIKISFEHDGCHWHHVDKEHIVAMPAHIHNIIHHTVDNKLEGVLG